MLKSGCLALSLCALAVPAAAQQIQWTDNAFVSVNGGVQAGSHDLSSTQTFPLYDQNAVITSSQSGKSSGLFDISAGYRVWHNVAVSVGYTYASSSGTVAVSGSIPDKVFFDRPHTFNATLSGAKHTENVVNLDAVWMMPMTDKVDVAVSAGPSVFMVKQDVAGAVDENTLAASLTHESKTAVGLNAGVDVTYLIGKKWGVGGLARYTWASTELGASSDDVTLGGFQIGGGVRVRF